MACNRLAGAASFEPGLASGNGLFSTLRKEGSNMCGIHSGACAIIQAIKGLPQKEWLEYALQAADAGRSRE